MFIPATPKSELKKRYEDEIKKSKIKIRVVEKAGSSLKDILQKSDPLGDRECTDPENCFICSTGGKGNCRRENITYKIKCDYCDHTYIGESARNAYTRGLEHKSALVKKDKNSVLYRHITTMHNENHNITFTMSVTGSYKDALTRQLSEAHNIEMTPNLINNKSEWGHTNLPRIQLSSQQNTRHYQPTSHTQQ